MPDVPVRVTIRVNTPQKRARRPRTYKWIGYERRVATLWETNYYV